MLNDELLVLSQFGWTVEPSDDESVCSKFSGHEKNRSGNIPERLMDLICKFNVCANKEDTAWFVTHENFGDVSENEFAWNEFEIQSIEAALDDDDLKNDVSNFWNSHFCFLMSVKSGYSHMSIKTRGDNIGNVVWGFEPEYEEASFFAASFDEFMGILVRHVTGKEINSTLSQIV
jgi:hypothetical protein